MKLATVLAAATLALASSTAAIAQTVADSPELYIEGRKERRREKGIIHTFGEKGV